jgi:hypothetical protein
MVGWFPCKPDASEGRLLAAGIVAAVPLLALRAWMAAGLDGRLVPMQARRASEGRLAEKVRRRQATRAAACPLDGVKER